MNACVCVSMRAQCLTPPWRGLPQLVCTENLRTFELWPCAVHWVSTIVQVGLSSASSLQGSPVVYFPHEHFHMPGSGNSLAAFKVPTYFTVMLISRHTCKDTRTFPHILPHKCKCQAPKIRFIHGSTYAWDCHTPVPNKAPLLLSTAGTLLACCLHLVLSARIFFVHTTDYHTSLSAPCSSHPGNKPITLP